MDAIEPLLRHFSLRAGVFHTGELCGKHDFSEDRSRGHLHLIRRGAARLTGIEGRELHITEPTIVFLPRPERHCLIADGAAGAEVVCGTVQFGNGGRNPVSDSLPDLVLVTLAALPGIEALLDLMFYESGSSRCGGQAVLDRLLEVLVIRLLRHCIEQGLIMRGSLAGLGDKRLAKALGAIHDDPTRAWRLSDMAELAGMSRARFAVRFRTVTGDTPAEYLALWRLYTAQKLLQQGLPLKRVAESVGYSSANALNRVFLRKLGFSPSDWLNGKLQTPYPAQVDTLELLSETHGAQQAASSG